jgi:hypothetical protein
MFLFFFSTKRMPENAQFCPFNFPLQPKILWHCNTGFHLIPFFAPHSTSNTTAIVLTKCYIRDVDQLSFVYVDLNANFIGEHFDICLPV